MSQLQFFRFEGTNVRTKVIKGEPWFVVKDVCDVLDLTNPTIAMQTVDDEDRAKFNLGRGVISNIVNESGLYSLIMSSRKPEARRFKRWITSEVLPKIRRTGSYVIPQMQPSYMFEHPVKRAERWIEEYQDKQSLQQKLSEYSPKISYLDEIIESEGTVTVSEIAMDYGISAIELNQILANEKIQYKARNGRWMPYSKFSKDGYMKSITQFVHDSNRETPLSFVRTRWTQKGRVKIHEILANRGISPVMKRGDF
ncbi:phage antirepressor KilAC domain-containing protein [Paenibacillus luteus]|uniref:phage antirepressor KilAC domain-containing protein n=1 Tax=Paenibacillus luteus TaxID=2545753 RepID=UPI00114133B9|nr:phage antirepressor KilAC domain-containing protein [Paenibacillus luteus]